MTAHFKIISEDEEFRQGDIIKRIPAATNTPPQYGFVVTADCDIAQKKAGEIYTYLEAVTAEEYVRNFWAKEQVSKLLEKNSVAACSELNAAIRKHESRLDDLDPSSLSEWLTAESPEKIITLCLNGKNSEPLQKKLEIIKILISSDDYHLKKLIMTWQKLGRSEKEIRNFIKDAIGGEGGFPDYFLIPGLLDAEKVGFVILLRSIRSIGPSELFRSHTEARVNGKPDAFFRVCRLQDDIRFSVAQKMAFLYSRIGMKKGFEDSCDALTQDIAETLFREGI